MRKKLPKYDPIYPYPAKVRMEQPDPHPGMPGFANDPVFLLNPR